MAKAAHAGQLDEAAPEVEAAGAAEASQWRPAFEAVLRRILAEYEGTDAKVRDGMESGMRRLFEFPYHAELGALNGGKAGPLDVTEAQRVVFFPRLSDMRRYVAAFARDTTAASARREKLMKFKMMSVFYTLHRKDGTLVDRFMHYGGLDSLVALTAEDNNVIQSQAVELLMEMLSPLMTLPSATSSRQAHLHHQAFVCLCSGAFWSNLARIVAEPHEVFPRSHSYCVRILAGAVGWLRPDDPNAVPEAGPPPAVREAAEALQRLLAGSTVAPDVRGLAEDLLQELLEVPMVRQDPLRGEDLAAASRALFAPEAEARENSAHAWQTLRQLGNEAFSAGLVWPAEASYRLALQEGASAVPSSEASLIHSNRALALLRAGHPGEAAIASAHALEQDPRNAKAAYRRAQALLEHAGTADDTRGAAIAARDAVAAAELAAELEPRDQRVAEVLARARRRAEELREAGNQTAGPEADSFDVMD